MKVIRGCFIVPRRRLLYIGLLTSGRPCGVAVGFNSRKRFYVAFVPSVRYGR